MARTYNIPGQNISFRIPEDGEVFTDPNHQGVYKWEGNRVLSLSLNYHDGAYHDAQGNRIDIGINKNSLPEYNVGDLVRVVTKMGGRYSEQAPFAPSADYTAFRPKPVSSSGEVFTQGVSSTNPHAATLTSSARGDISRPSPQYAQEGALPASAIYQPNENRNYYSQDNSARTLPVTAPVNQATPQTQTTQGGTGIDPNYQWQPGETSEAYNARVAQYNQTKNAQPGTPGNPDLSSMPPEFQEIYSQLETYLQELQKRGQVLNPSIDITPDKVAQFMSQAENEINPYYASQLKLARESLENQLGYATDKQFRAEERTQEDYQNQLRTLGETSADQGFALSGIRQRGERELAFNTQNAINEARNDLSYTAGNAARTFMQNYGANQFQAPTMREMPIVTPGEMNFGGTQRQLPVYQISPAIYDGLIGTQEYQRRADVKTRASGLEGAYRSQEALNQARALNL